MSTRKHLYDTSAPIAEEQSGIILPLRWNKVSEQLEGGPDYPAVGSIIPPEQNFGFPGYVVGGCGHRVAGSEWLAGLHNCERCGG